MIGCRAAVLLYVAFYFALVSLILLLVGGYRDVVMLYVALCFCSCETYFTAGWLDLVIGLSIIVLLVG